MSKLIERLDQLESYVYYCDGVDGTSHKNAYSPCDDIRFKEVLGDAYPQLRAVIEAAIGIKQREDIGGYGHEGMPELLTALAALEV